jgi:DNA repair exonuclease SbcCD nuclease subunit
MKVLLWSDLHLHDWPQLSSITDSGVNDRLIDGVAVMNQLLSVCEDEDIKYRIFAGDLFHKRGELTTEVLNYAYNHFANKSSDVMDVILIGNHDLSLNTDFHALECFKSINNCIVVDTHRTIKFEDETISFHPWEDDRMSWRTNYLETVGSKNIAMSIMHYDFSDILYRGNPIGTGKKSTLLRPEVHNFSGHYHDQISNNVVTYIGSPMQHNWGDVGSNRGYIIVDIQEGKVCDISRFELNVTPKFLEFKDFDLLDDSFKTGDVTNNFVKVLVHDSTTTEEKNTIRERLLSSSARRVIFGVSPSVLPIDEDINIPSENITKNLDEILKEFINKSDTSLDKKMLYKLGMSILRGAGSDI